MAPAKVCNGLTCARRGRWRAGAAKAGEGERLGAVLGAVRLVPAGRRAVRARHGAVRAGLLRAARDRAARSVRYFLLRDDYPELRGARWGAWALADVAVGLAGAALWVAPFLLFDSLRPSEPGFDLGQLGPGGEWFVQALARDRLRRA